MADLVHNLITSPQLHQSTRGKTVVDYMVLPHDQFSVHTMLTTPLYVKNCDLPNKQENYIALHFVNYVLMRLRAKF